MRGLTSKKQIADLWVARQISGRPSAVIVPRDLRQTRLTISVYVCATFKEDHERIGRDVDLNLRRFRRHRHKDTLVLSTEIFTSRSQAHFLENGIPDL